MFKSKAAKSAGDLYYIMTKNSIQQEEMTCVCVRVCPILEQMYNADVNRFKEIGSITIIQRDFSNQLHK